jgi:hypothetical protein
MASLTIRNIPEDAKLRFRQVAAAHGRSMEEHLRQLVLSAGADDSPFFSGVREMPAQFHHFQPDPKAKSRARVERLIALGRGLDFEAPKRAIEPLREIDFS